MGQLLILDRTRQLKRREGTRRPELRMVQPLWTRPRYGALHRPDVGQVQADQLLDSNCDGLPPDDDAA